MREARGKDREGKRQTGKEKEADRERQTLRGSFAAEVKAELLGSRKWDRLLPRSLCCVYVLWVCVCLQGRPTLHQHRSGLYVCVCAFSLYHQNMDSVHLKLHFSQLLQFHGCCVLCMCGAQVKLNQPKHEECCYQMFC